MSEQNVIKRDKESRLKSLILLVFSTFILGGALLGFGQKIAEFLRVWYENPEAKFALIPVSIYFATVIGFVCLFVWGTMHGMLSDIEGPKYRMLEEELELQKMEEKEGINGPFS
jgi:nitrogen fixation-related uncharacterized protein